jgi:hypothetical protein
MISLSTIVLLLEHSGRPHDEVAGWGKLTRNVWQIPPALKTKQKKTKEKKIEESVLVHIFVFSIILILDISL